MIPIISWSKGRFMTKRNLLFGKYQAQKVGMNFHPVSKILHYKTAFPLALMLRCIIANYSGSREMIIRNISYQ